ncbi:FAD-binding oxidoreductase [Deinococcus sp.]|uniref:NAD(P)/FAD-dependent oxidoreductase n=1 Tax=Deinococcus sp. TaxID=47478 RepID=UPI0025C12EB9|nr:FAD-dependent oxidoreductase [Deinococcus sp.]
MTTQKQWRPAIIHHPAPITIIGAGLIGATIAFTLRRAGYAVTLWDADLPGAAWKAGAGMLTPDGEGLTGCLAQKARESLRLWPGFARDLEAQSGVNVHFREGLERTQPDGSRRMTPGEGQVHPPSVVQAALHGLEVRRETYTLSPSPGSVLAEQGGGSASRPTSSAPFPLTILAAGAFSACFGLPVFPVQGQALLLEAHSERPALFGHRRRGEGAKAYALARPDGVYVGATVRQTACPQPDAHARRWLEQARGQLLPELYAAPVKQTLVGLRPGTADGLPIVGPHPAWPNVLVATGHGRHGALLAPWTAREILRLVQERTPLEARA